MAVVGNKPPFWLAWIFGLAGIGLVALAARIVSVQRALDSRGQVTNAVVTGYSRSSGGSGRYNLRYTYTLAGTTYNGGETVRRPVWRSSSQIGKTISVVYLPEDPAVNRIAGSRAETAGWILLAMSVIPIGTSLIMLRAFRRAL